MYSRFLNVPSFRFFLLVLGLCKCHVLGDSSQCNIAPGGIGLTKHPPRVAVVLNCTFNRHSVDAVIWTRNDQPIEDNDILKDSKDNKRWSAVVLYTNSTSFQDVGKLTCKAKRGQDVVSSCSVHPSKPKLEKLPSELQANFESVPELTCKGSGWPVPRVSWWRNGSRIRDGDYHSSYLLKVFPGNTLVMKILSIVGYHHGAYTCRAENLFGITEENVFIRVKRHDMINNDYVEQQGVVAMEGRNTTLQCICVNKDCSEENATTLWNYNGRNVNASQKFRLSTEVYNNNVKIVLAIFNVSLTDQGVYNCGIYTSKGFEESPRKLHIIAKDSAPQISPDPENVSAVLWSSARLKCNVIYPAILIAPETFWVFNNTRIPKESQYYHSEEYGPMTDQESKAKFIPFELHIHNASTQNVGWYTCGVDFKIDVVKANIFFNLKAETPGDQDDGQNTDADSNESPLVAITSITAGGIIMGFVAAFVAFKLCRNKRNTEEPFFETPLNGRQFKYDVFVTFSNQDLNWVNKELLPLLDKHKLNYCIHDRDFEIGKPVVDNMADSVYTSRKVLAIMSHNYMSSKFCRGELEMALYRSTEMGDASVIVMRIDGVDRSKLPKALRNRTFLDHYDFTERKTWEERLIKHLKPPQSEKNTEKKSLERNYSLLRNNNEA